MGRIKLPEDHERLSTEAYELLALGLRYWFVLLGLVIVLRAGRWAWHDRKVYLRTLSALPDAGLMGELVNLDTGEGLPLPREGVIGSGKACDIRLKGLRRREAFFELREGQGVLLVSCHRRHQILLDGQPIGRRSFGLHGSRLSFPGYFLRMRLFEGLDVPARSLGQDEDEQPSGAPAFSIEDYAQQGALDALPLAPPDLGGDQPLQETAPGAPSETLFPQITWVYAAPPATGSKTPTATDTAAWGEQDFATPIYPEGSSADEAVAWPRRRRRRDRHEKD